MTIITVLAALAVLAFIWIPLPYLIRKRSEIRLRELVRSQKTISLTYDDGPGEYLTGRLLDLLDEYDVKATFFVLGSKLDSRAASDAIATRGHELACHGFGHVNAWYASPLKAWSDIARGLDRFHELGIDCQLIRPPFGKITLLSLIQASLSGKRFGWWTLDSTDTAPERGSVQAVIEQIEAAGGGVVLLHDFDNGRDSDRVEFVVDVTRAILEFARRHGFRVQPQGSLLPAL